VRTSDKFGRYSSAIRAACANERSCGSARGAISNGRPYRDRQQPESLLNCVINASGGVVGKITDWAFSKAPESVHQADVALLNQVQHGSARGGVFLCNAHDLGKVSLN